MTELGGGAGYVLTEVGGTKRIFDADGLMTDIVSPQGHSLHFEYEETLTDLPGTAPYTIDPSQALTVARVHRLQTIEERIFVAGQTTGR